MEAGKTKLADHNLDLVDAMVIAAMKRRAMKKSPV